MRTWALAHGCPWARKKGWPTRLGLGLAPAPAPDWDPNRDPAPDWDLNQAPAPDLDPAPAPDPALGQGRLSASVWL